MSISAVERKMPNAVSVEVSGKALRVRLSDGSTVSIPVDLYPRFAYATKQERANWRIIGRGHGIHWEDIDEDISVQGLLAGNPSGESKSSFMRWLEARPRPKLPPWKGESYGKANDFGIPANLLILGESHFGQLNGWNKPRRDVAHDQLGERQSAFFTGIMRTVLGTNTLEQRAPFFKTVAFYSYIQRTVDIQHSIDPQRIVGAPHETLPTKEMWDEAAVPFLTSLEWLHPTHILACGLRLWDHMPEPEGVWSPPSEKQVRWFDCVDFPTPRRPKSILGCYRHSQGQSAVLAIHHPFWTRYQPGAWHPVVKRFLEYHDG